MSENPIFTNLKKRIRAHRASSKLLDNFLRSNNSKINQSYKRTDAQTDTNIHNYSELTYAQVGIIFAQFRTIITQDWHSIAQDWHSIVKYLSTYTYMIYTDIHKNSELMCAQDGILFAQVLLSLERSIWLSSVDLHTHGYTQTYTKNSELIYKHDSITFAQSCTLITHLLSQHSLPHLFQSSSAFNKTYRANIDEKVGIPLSINKCLHLLCGLYKYIRYVYILVAGYLHVHHIMMSPSPRWHHNVTWWRWHHNVMYMIFFKKLWQRVIHVQIPSDWRRWFSQFRPRLEPPAKFPSRRFCLCRRSCRHTRASSRLVSPPECARASVCACQGKAAQRGLIRAEISCVCGVLCSRYCACGGGVHRDASWRGRRQRKSHSLVCMA